MIYMATGREGKGEVRLKRDEVLHVYVNGASRGNPGPAAYAYVFAKEDEEIIDKKATT